MHFRTFFISLILLTYHALALAQLDIEGIKQKLPEEMSDSTRISLLFDLTSHFYNIDLDSAFHYNEQALKLAESKERLIDVARGKVNLGLMFIHQRKRDSAEINLQEGLTILSEYPDNTLMMFANANLGILHHYDADYDDAVGYYLQSADFAAQIPDTPGISRAYYNIGDIFKSNKLFNRSNFYFRKMMSLNESPPRENFLLASLSIADFHRKNNQLDSARHYYELSIPKRHLITNERIRIDFEHVAGSLASAEGNYENALIHFKNAVLTSEELGDSYQMTSCYCELARVAGLLGRRSMSTEYFDKFEEANKELDNIYLEKECYLNYSNILSEFGEHEKARALLLKSINLNDSIYKLENRTLLSDLESKYQSEKKDQDLALQKTLTEKRTLQRNTMIISSVLLLGIAGLIYWFWRNKLRQRALITAQEIDLKEFAINKLNQQNQLLAMTSMIEGQEAERARIAQDLHDGLGGLMATIKSHFHNIQKEVDQLHAINIYEKTGNLINEASEEVRRISHNMMPASLQLMGLKGAIEDLAQNLTQQGQATTVEILGKKDRFDSSREIMLYRIIQELSHNVVKHANSDHLLIQLMQSETDVNILIEDDGIGFDTEHESAGLGLRSIRSRVDFLNGKLDVFSKKGEGSSVHIQAPLNNVAG